MTLWLRLLLLSCFTVLIASSASAQTQDRATTSGLALGLGIGHSSGGLGGHVHYYLQLPSERWRFSVHAGIGIIGYVKIGNEPQLRGGVAGGLMTAFGASSPARLGCACRPIQCLRISE